MKGPSGEDGDAPVASAAPLPEPIPESSTVPGQVLPAIPSDATATGSTGPATVTKKACSATGTPQKRRSRQ